MHKYRLTSEVRGLSDGTNLNFTIPYKNLRIEEDNILNNTLNFLHGRRKRKFTAMAMVNSHCYTLEFNGTPSFIVKHNNSIFRKKNKKEKIKT